MVSDINIPILLRISECQFPIHGQGRKTDALIFGLSFGNKMAPPIPCQNFWMRSFVKFRLILLLDTHQACNLFENECPRINTEVGIV